MCFVAVAECRVTYVASFLLDIIQKLNKRWIFKITNSLVFFIVKKIKIKTRC